MQARYMSPVIFAVSGILRQCDLMTYICLDSSVVMCVCVCVCAVYCLFCVCNLYCLRCNVMIRCASCMCVMRGIYVFNVSIIDN